MKPSIQTLGQILYSPSQYVIPVFQRNYRWETPQWAKLWDSLTEIQRPDKRGNHFMGFLVFVPGLPQPGQHTTFHLVDGQQRLSTSCILLTAIRNVAREIGHQDLADEIHQYYLVHPLKKGEQYYRLLPKERDHDSYLSIVSGNGDPTGRMADALAYFEEQLSTLSVPSPEWLRQVFDAVCRRLEFMCATLEAENAYNIFKSLNSTGVPLGPSDLIRNFVFMHVLPDEHDEFHRELWNPLEERFARSDGTLDEERFSKFFRDYLMSSGRYVPPKETFPNFEARYEATEFSPKDLARTLINFSLYYEVISGAKQDVSVAVTSGLAGLNALESSTTYPLLLTLFDKRAQGGIGSEQLATAIEMLRGFIMRRFICGESSRGYGQMFVRALGKADGEPIKVLESYLLDRGWPDDLRFQTCFVDFPLYERGYKKEVLETLERSRGHKEPADLSKAEVEHVLPQTLSDGWYASLGKDAKRVHADWRHRPGNLTLSGYNKELWNHDFPTKRLRYAQSNIVLTRELSDYSRWGEEEIRKRGQNLAKEAAQIWIGPKEQIARPAAELAVSDVMDRYELRGRFWTGLNDYLVAEHSELPHFEARSSWSIRLPSGIRHIGVELRLGLRQGAAGIDIWFWREASMPLWEQIRAVPDEYNQLVKAIWGFEQSEGRPRARMFVDLPVSDLRDESLWPAVYRWLGEKLSLVYERVAPRLREQMDKAEVAS